MPELESVISGAIASAGLDIGDATSAAGDVSAAADDSGGAADDTGTDDSGDETPAVEASGDEEAADEGAAAAGDTSAEGAVVEGQQGKKAGPIPFEKHKTILENTRKTARDEGRAEAQQEIQTLRSQVETYALERQAYGLADTNPELFAKVMLEDEKVGAAIRKALGSQAPAGQETPAAAGTKRERPKADRLLDDGAAGYSQETLDALLAFERDELTAQLTEKFNALVQEKFGAIEPLVSEHQAGKAFEAARVRMSSVVEDARTNWPGFKDHESEVKAFLMKPENARMSLEEGYRRVVVPKIQTDRDTMRAEILKELEGREAAVTSVTGPKTKAVADKKGPRSTEQIIRESIAAKGLSI